MKFPLTATALEFRRAIGKYLDQVTSGQPVIITRRGQRVAVMVPFEEYREYCLDKAVQKRAHLTAEADYFVIEAVANAQMDPRHNHLNELLDD
jgi:prevent-host-death family protein